MRILAIESSAGPASVAIGSDGGIDAHYYENSGLTHSRTIMPMITSMFSNTDINIDDIDVVAVSVGPGSFTGVRIGVAAAKGLAWAKDKPCCAVSSLLAMGMNVSFRDGLICAVMDARRGQVYNALFEADGGQVSRLTPDRAVSLEQLAAELEADGRTPALVGDGAKLCYNYLNEHNIGALLPPGHVMYQSAAGVYYAAREKVIAGELVAADELVPFYLRRSQAEREKGESICRN